MYQYIIMCRSLTYAQRAMTALERAGITVAIARIPQLLSDSGCGYCVKVSEKRFHQALRVLERANLPYGRIFRKAPDEDYTEVLG